MTDTAPPSDQVLLARYAAGDEAAFTDLVLRHQDLVCAVCRRRLPAVEADDAAQAVFIILSRKAASLTTHTCLPAWLHRTAAQVVNNAVRRRAVRERAEARAAVAAHVDTVAPPPTADHDVTAAIEALPEAQRQVVTMHFLAGLDRERIAAELGCPVATVSTRLHRAVRRLRRRLGVADAAEVTSLIAVVDHPFGASSTTLLASPATASSAATHLATTTIAKVLMTKLVIAAASAVAVLACSIAAVHAAGAAPTSAPAWIATTPQDAAPVAGDEKQPAAADAAVAVDTPQAAARVLSWERMLAVGLVTRAIAEGETDAVTAAHRQTQVVTALEAVVRPQVEEELARTLDQATLRWVDEVLSRPAGAALLRGLALASAEENVFWARRSAEVWKAFNAVLDGGDGSTMTPLPVSEMSELPPVFSDDPPPPHGGLAFRREAAETIARFSDHDRLLARAWIDQVLRQAPAELAARITARREVLDGALAHWAHEPYVVAVSRHAPADTMRTVFADFATHPETMEASARFMRFDLVINDRLTSQYGQLYEIVRRVLTPPPPDGAGF